MDGQDLSVPIHCGRHDNAKGARVDELRISQAAFAAECPLLSAKQQSGSKSECFGTPNLNFLLKLLASN
jgi:hypothetical protein